MYSVSTHAQPARRTPHCDGTKGEKASVPIRRHADTHGLQYGHHQLQKSKQKHMHTQGATSSHGGVGGPENDKRVPLMQRSASQ